MREIGSLGRGDSFGVNGVNGYETDKRIAHKETRANSVISGALLEEQQEDHLAIALDLIREAEKLFMELGSPMREKAREVRERLEGVNGYETDKRMFDEDTSEL